MLKFIRILLRAGTSKPRRPGAAAGKRSPRVSGTRAPGSRQTSNGARGGGYAAATPAPVLDEISRPSRTGRMTGFEPRTLRDYHAPISICAKGIAGLGLFESDFGSSSVYTGQLGEVGFYKALCRENLIDNFSSYWSVAMPGQDGRAVPDERFNTDVDCVIVQGETIFLIDLKYYASGAVTWHSRNEWLLCRDDATGKQVKKPRKMSRNMAMAQDRFPGIFPGKKIVSYVVLIPTDDGIGTVAPGTAWPGGIPLITLPEMLDRLRAGGTGYADAVTDSAMTALLKDETDRRD